MADGDRRRVAVVGASAGLGRCIGVGLGRRGAQVALLARRLDRLTGAAAEAGDDAVAVACDVTDEASCRQAISEASEALGGIDALVYATGMSVLAPLDELTAEQWHAMFATNVVGASVVTAAAAPHLSASGGTAIYLSSLSASFTGPWPMLAAYAVTKAALDKLVQAWRVEHPDISFTRLAVGDSNGGKGDSQTEFNKNWEPGAFTKAVNLWLEEGYMQGGLVDPDHLTDIVDAVIRCGKSSFLPEITLAPRPSTTVSEMR